MQYDTIDRNRGAEVQMNFLEAALKCDLGEKDFRNVHLAGEY